MPTWTANVSAYKAITAAKRPRLGAAANVQRRLIRYAVAVPATKLIALARSTCRPTT